MKVAVMGYGTVGSGVVEVIEHHSDIIPKRTGGKALEISHILDLRDFPNDAHKDLFTKDFNDILNDEETKIVAETMGGVNPAFDFTMKLLKAGKSVVTSNKELVAQRGLELLQAAEDTAARAPHLYECAAGAVLPILKIEENGVTWQKESCLLTAQGNTRLSPNETAMAQLLQERTMPVEFALEGETVTLQRCVVSVEADGDGFAVTLTGQRRAGTPLVEESVCRQLEALCEETILRAWQSGADLLRLGAVRALKEGPGASFTTKNACPEVRASVKMLDL